MEPKKTIEINCRRGIPRLRLRDGDGWPQIVIGSLAVRHDHVQAVYRAALKNCDERLAPAAS